MAAGSPHLVICSKSTWDPAIRREHALARIAADAGVRVTFIERPVDVRSIRSRRGARTWLGALSAPPSPHTTAPITVLKSAVLVPAHRGALAEATATRLLARQLRRIPDLARATVLAYQPWQWPAVAEVPAARRVFDSTDDWARQIPAAAARVDALYARIGAEADAVTTVSADMATRFGPAEVVHIRNGVAPALLTPTVAAPGEARMVWAGTLSERFDAPLAEGILTAAPDWGLDLYGQCQYAGRGEAPGDDLRALLDAHPGRVRYHGVLRREDLAAAVDRADVAVILNRVDHTQGQDSMKLYDYAARGRPIISTRFPGVAGRDVPPALTLADDAASFAAALAPSAALNADGRAAQRAWAENHAWSRRWPEFRAILFPGDG